MKIIYQFIQILAIMLFTFGLAFLAAIASPNNTKYDSIDYEEGAYRYFENEFKMEGK